MVVVGNPLLQLGPAARHVFRLPPQPQVLAEACFFCENSRARPLSPDILYEHFFFFKSCHPPRTTHVSISFRMSALPSLSQFTLFATKLGPHTLTSP